MAANTLALNQVFPIYNADGTSFHGLVLRKSVIDSVVMSLGDKATGDVYYRDNTLQVTMQEYIVYNGVRYCLVNPPTVVREGIVSDNSELNGMTKYSFEFYHPMYMLGNFPFSDVAVNSGEGKYLSQDKKFSWIGKPQDFIDKLNKNLEGTQWVVAKSSRFPQEKDDELSEVQTFEDATVADAIKRGYEIWDTPYVVSQLPATDARYAQGKRFLVEYGLPSNEIYENDEARQMDTPFVFRFGQGVGLKNNSRTPRNNKIVTRIAGYGSEDNVPYGYPQIVWTGNQEWDYTINNNPNDPLSYPIYKGIVGGQYVKLIKHPFTRTHLMPTIFSDTVNKKVNPLATGYDPTIEIKDYYDAVYSQQYPYVNEINVSAPCYQAHEFSDIKPELDSDRNLGLISVTPLNADLTPASSWDDTMDDDGNYVQSYFKVKLPQLTFDLYACAAITQEMQVNMRSGACIGCTFPVQVDWDDYKLNFYTQDGDFAPDGTQRDLTKYPKSNQGQIEIILKKENSTFGTLMPNIYQQPATGDVFVFLGISLPLSYITAAEERLDDAMKTYMLENNVYYHDYPLKFDEHFLATHSDILEQIRPNSVIRFEYGGEQMQLFVKQLTVKYENKPLPTYDITLTDNIDVTLNQIGQVADDVEKLSSLISILRQNYSRNIWNELAKKLSKSQDDTASGFIRFIKGLQVAETFTGGILGEGGIFRKEADGTTYIEADRLYIRMKAYFDSVEIREYRHSAGNRIASSAGQKNVRVEWIQIDGNNDEVVLEQTQQNLQSVDFFRCYFRASDGEDTVRNNFQVGDQVYCHVTTVSGANDNPSEKGMNQKHYWRLCIGRNTEGTLTDNGEGWIDISNRTSETVNGTVYSGYQTGSDVPESQDDMIQLGNVLDLYRRGAIVEFVSGGNSPSYQVFQSIGDIGSATSLSDKHDAQYTLDGKNYISLGYNTGTGRAYLNTYGDFYFGDRPASGQTEGNSFIKYNSANRQLDIKARINAQSTIGGDSIEQYIRDHQNNYDDTEVWQELANQQAQIDGAIETYYMTGVPSLLTPPVVNPQGGTYSDPWLDGTETAEERTRILNNHVGDLYYDKATGHGYRFMYDEENQVFLWTVLTDEDVTEALRIANEAQTTANGKITIYTAWNAWIVNNVNKLQVKDLLIPASDIQNTSYKANKVYRCTTAGDSPVFTEINYTDDTTVNSIINQYGHILNITPTAANVGEALGYLRQVLGGSTQVDGGLILTNAIFMKDAETTPQIWAGISGTYQTSETGAGWKGHGTAAWYGGGVNNAIPVDYETLTDAQKQQGWNVQRWAKSLFRFDGSGYLAGGNISWTKDGIVTIKDITTLYDSQNTDILNQLTLFSNAFHFATSAGTTTVLSISPQAAFTNLELLVEGNRVSVASQSWVETNYVSKAFFNRLFQAYSSSTIVDGNKVSPNDTTTAIDNLKILVGAWTNQYLSALGINPNSGSGGGGATALSDLVDVQITSPSANQILQFDGTHWVNAAAPITYTLPIAGSNTLGGIMTGYTASGKNYPVAVDANGNAYVNVPWTDTSYTLPLAADGTRGGIQIGYTENGRNYAVQLSNEKAYVNVPWTDTTYSVFTDSVDGLVPMASNANKTTAESAVGNYYLCADGKFRLLPANAFENTWTAWSGATESAAGTAGYMPAPSSAQRLLFLRGDGSWVSLNDYSLPTASTTEKGGVKVGTTLSISNEVLDLVSGVATAGTYRSVTVDTYGRVTAGSNPTTIAGYGITDAKIESGTITLGSATITPVTSVAMSVPTGFSVAGSPVSGSGTITIAYTNGYEGFTTDLKNKINLLYSLFTREGSGTAADPYVIKANYGLYTNEFLSALGLNSGSGGGSGSTTLYGLTDVRADGAKVAGAVTGYVLTYGSDGKWYADQAGLNTTDLATYLTQNGYATQTWVQQQGYIGIGSVKGNLSTWDNSAMGWGTLTAANGYTIGVHASSSDGGDWGMAYKNGQISMQLDGYYYQNEGQYRVLDTSDIGVSVASQSALGNYLPLSGGTINGILTIAPANISGYQDGIVLHDYGGGGSEGLKIRFTSSSYTTGITLGANSDKTGLLINDTYTIYHSGNLTNVSQLTNDSGYITSSGSCAYATSAGNADTVDGYHAGSFLINSGLRSDQRSLLYAPRWNFGGFDKGDFGGTYADDYPYNYGVYWSLTDGDRNSGAIFAVECATSNVLGHISVATRGAGDWNTTFSSWGTLAYISDNVASATKLQTARTIWGQSFDGSGNITGSLALYDGSRWVTISSHRTGYGYASLGGIDSQGLYFSHQNEAQTAIGYMYLRYDGFQVSTDLTSLGTESKYTQNSTRAQVHHKFEGADCDYGVVQIIHTSSKGSGAAGSYTASLAIFDERANTISGDVYQPTFYINRSGATRVPDIMGCDVGGTRIFTIQSGGNVGIGTTSPSYKLHVAGEGYFTSYVGINGGINSGYALYVNGKSYFTQGLCVGGSNSLYGGLYVNTGNSYFNNELHVNDWLVMHNNSIYLGSDDNSTEIYGGSDFSVNTPSGGHWFMIGGDDIFNINTNFVHAYVGFYSDSYVSALGQNTSSDARLKDIEDYDALLDVETIANAPAVHYLWKNKGELGRQVGSIAQYWKSYLPEAIHEDNEGYMSMQYGVIALLAAISTAKKVQDHEQRIRELEKENERLRTEVEQMKAA